MKKTKAYKNLEKLKEVGLIRNIDDYTKEIDKLPDDKLTIVDLKQESFIEMLKHRFRKRKI